MKELVKKSSPPFFAMFLLGTVIEKKSRTHLLGDFEMLYNQKLDESNKLVSWFWFWGQTILNICGFTLNSNIHGAFMFKKHLKNGFRNLGKNKICTSINIVGLAAGIVCSLMIGIWINSELSFENCHEKLDRIYRIDSDLSGDRSGLIWPIAPAPLAAKLREDFAEVEKSMLIGTIRLLVENGNTKFYEENIAFTQPDFLNIFTVTFINGSAKNFFADRNSIIIDDETSMKYFGSLNVLGKTLTFNRKTTYSISGVFKKFKSTHLEFNILAPFDFYAALMPKKIEQWSTYDFITYVLLKKGVDEQNFQNKIKRLLAKYSSNTKTCLILQPVKDIHLYTESGTGSINKLYLFGFIGVVILLLACINYVNLTTAQSAARSKEIAVRKIMGADRKSIISQILSETLIITIICSILSITAIAFALPYFNDLTEKSFELSEILNINNILLVFGVILFTTFTAGFYPALVLSSFEPNTVLRNSKGNKKGFSFIRKGLVILQFSVSIVFIFVILQVNEQINFMLYKNLGFEKENTLIIKTNPEIKKNLAAVKSKIASLPFVGGVTTADRIPVDMGNFMELTSYGGKTDNKQITFHGIDVEDNYLHFMNIQLIQGENLSARFAETGIIINEEAVRQMGLANPIGEKLTCYAGEREIIGVVKDFHYKPLTIKILPIIIMKLEETSANHIFVKIKGRDLKKANTELEKLIKAESPSFPYVFKFFDDELNQQYLSEMKTEKMASYFTVLVIIISALGIFGLSAFAAQNRRKEIGIRKVLGADIKGLVFKSLGEFVFLVFAAAILAFPTAYFYMQDWLQSYVYRVEINYSLFAVSLLISVAIIVITVIYNVIKMTSINPVESLKEE